MNFRKILIRIRKEYNTNPKKLFGLSAGSSILAAIITLLIDMFLPFESWGIIVRSFILIPTSASIFLLLYSVGLFMNRVRNNYYEDNKESTAKWVPYRLRFSLSTRRRIAAIIGAILFVIVYANGFKTGYTLISSIFVSMLIILAAFIRPTKEEHDREKFNIPDTRDVVAKEYVESLKKEKNKK